ncbi:hypothetical protein AAFC00_002465 [Neodothiora populina]|uniref:DUF2415 domain-containing protein n=1 Tax=Neodothiora populina TaxID=2781224 RepID=A0ABR3P7H3_9PEZI
MAIDSFFFSETDRLAHANKTFIPVKIPVSHWQLRHYISSPEKDTLYYASGNEVYHLNTVTRKRKHLTTLPFEARCTASGHGYVCVGGEDEGHFAIIRLETQRPARHADVDFPLPIEGYWEPVSVAPRAANVRIERIGEEIVNSISIHHIQDEEAHLYDVVAVLTNNDRTVRVYSLQHATETACMELPFPMNHASISPDGRSLVAVGDSNQAFFYTRVLQQTPPQIPKPHNRLNTGAVTWETANVVHLRSEPLSRDSSQVPGYFTTAWSPSGHLVAVGSEGGHISVFDTQLFQYCDSEEGEDAIVATVPSTRPNIAAHLHPGAVRTIMFSPEPWDLLIWAEDQGRVCIADLRAGLRTKQTIELKPDEDGLAKITVEDVSNDGGTLDHQRRLLDLEDALMNHTREGLGDSAASGYAAEALAARELIRQQQNLRRDFPSLADTSALADDPHGLTAREQQILESLRVGRQREEARSLGFSARSINYTTAGLFANRNRSPSRNSSEPRPSSDVLVNHNDPYAAFPELSRTSQRNDAAASERLAGDNTLPPLHSIQEYLRLRDQDNTASQRRRRAILAPPPHATRAATIPSNSTPEPEEDNPWRIDSADSRSNTFLARGPLFESPRSTEPSTNTNTNADTAAYRASANREQQFRRLAAQRDRLRSVRQEFGGPTAADSLYDSFTTLRGLIAPSSRNLATNNSNTNNGASSGATYNEYAEILYNRRIAGAGSRDVNIGVRTAGLAMSVDGRTLWAACEEGIFEIGINIRSRMAFPSIEMR